jgi:predicted RNase H-like nuclease
MGMSWIAGADGCRAGWFRVCRHRATGELRFDVLATVRELLHTAPAPRVLGIDIPIGLPVSGARLCDVEARKVLGPRRSSVFPAPVRAALHAATREEASRITQGIDGRKLSVQAWAICPKIREVDELLLADPHARARVFEVHPEVSFWKWNGERPMSAAKKKKTGREERLLRVEDWLGKGVVECARGPHLRKHLADDDILDSIATLWTAERISEDRSRELPEVRELDEQGLPMRIAY